MLRVVGVVFPRSGWSCLHIASDRGSLQDLRALRPHLTPALVNMSPAADEDLLALLSGHCAFARQE